MTEPRGPVTAAPDGAGPLPSRARLDERGRLDALGSVGGWRGIVEASLPTLVYMVGYVATQQVWPSGVAAVAVALVLGVARLVQRQSPVQVLAGLAVVVLSVVVSLTTGQARDYYLWGFVTNAAYGLAFAVSVLVGWPAAGLVLGLVRAEGTRFRTGVDSYLTLLDAQRQLFSVRQQLIADRLAQLSSEVELYKALGGGWSNTGSNAPQG